MNFVFGGALMPVRINAILLIFLTTAFAAASHELFADDADSVIFLDDDGLEENVLIVRHRAAAPLSPSSRTIKASEFLGKFTDLPSVLETVSGIGIRSMGGHGQYVESAIRGGTAKGLRVYLDGVLLNSAAAGAVDLSKIPLDKIKEIHVTKSTSGLKQMGTGMGGTIELFTEDENACEIGITGINIEGGSFGLLKGGVIIRRPVSEEHKHQLNINVSKSDNDYPFTHDNGTTIPTVRNPDPTWDDTLMRKSNNHYNAVDAAYALSLDIAGNHKITQQLSVGAFEQGLFVYHYKNDQSGLTSGKTAVYSIDYLGELTSRLTIGGEASGVYRHSAISDPDGHFSLGGGGVTLEANGGSADFLFDARYAITENIYLAGITGTRFEHHIQQNKALDGKSEMSRREYRAGAEAGLKTELTNSAKLESSLRLVYKHETDTSTAGFGYQPSDGKKYYLGYPSAEAVIRADFHPFTLQFSAAASKRSPTFFERFGWGSGFLSNPGLKEETRMETDMGASLDMGGISAAASIFAGRIVGKIKSIPQNSFVKVMNFADTDFYGAEFDISSRLAQIFTVELSAAYLNSVVIKADDPKWTGMREPFIPEFSGFLKTEADVWKINIGHGIKYESECYVSIENNEKKEAQYEFSAWVSYKAVDFLTLRYRIENYPNTASFDFLDNPKSRRTHLVAVNISL